MAARARDPERSLLLYRARGQWAHAGPSRAHAHTAAMRVVEIGSIVYSSALQRTPLGTEAQYLLARYAFETLGYRPL